MAQGGGRPNSVAERCIPRASLSSTALSSTVDLRQGNQPQLATVRAKRPVGVGASGGGVAWVVSKRKPQANWASLQPA